MGSIVTFIGWAAIAAFIKKSIDNVEERKHAYILKHVTFTGADGVTSPLSDVDSDWIQAHGGGDAGDVIMTGLDGATARVLEVDDDWRQEHIRSLALRMSLNDR